MANTTFNGPVRSQNGFQQLVDGVWTPVGGGGTTLIPYTPGTTNYTITGLTTPGDSASFAWEFHEPETGDELVVDAPVIPGTDQVLFVKTISIPTVGVDSGSDTPDIVIFDDNTGSWGGVFTATYVGNFTLFSDLFAVIVIDATSFEV